MNLYEIDDAILECVDLETGEIVDVEKMDALNMERERKIDNILCWIKNLKSDITALREEEKTLAERRRSAEKKADSLTAYIGGYLDGQKWSSPRAQATWRKSTAVHVIDEDETLKWCEDHAESAIKYAPPELDRSALRDLLKSGVEVAGAELVDKQNLQIK